ncbi:hypothetical protein I79_012236 [Cricetulus griseus]|uniref:Uncharacterized protein n=1 Tax=Cricetulus griseus TaxID=10029 RepID=G3HN99_CRIGR|nr:hypothetical protein I79_012236 [Cricetulus griseus]
MALFSGSFRVLSPCLTDFLVSGPGRGRTAQRKKVEKRAGSPWKQEADRNSRRRLGPRHALQRYLHGNPLLLTRHRLHSSTTEQVIQNGGP